MARISTYSQPTDVKGTDKLIGTDVENSNVTKNFTVSELSAYIADNQPSDLALVAVNLEWDTKSADPDANYVSKRNFVMKNSTAVQVTVPKLHMEFENLVLEPGSTYEVVIERFLPAKKRGAKDGYRSAGYKMIDPSTSAPPYDVRPASLPITKPEGDFYDFKFDYYFKESPWPSLAGYSTQTQIGYTKRLPIGFRIRKTTKGVVELSHTVRKIILLGNASDQIPTANTISFTEM